MISQYCYISKDQNLSLNLSAFAENHECKLVDECDIADTLSES